MSHILKRLKHNNRSRRLSTLTMTVLAVLLVAVACSAPASTTTPAPTGTEPLPRPTPKPTQMLDDFYDVHLITLSGEEKSLADFEGQVVMVNFWASWCGPCRIEMPELQAYYDDYQDEGLVLLAINRQESIEQVEAFIQAEGYTFPVLIDETGDAYNTFLLRTMPATVVFDGNGYLIWQHNGLLNQALLEEEVTPLLMAN